MRKPARTISQIRALFPKGINKLEVGSGQYPETGYTHLDIQLGPHLEILADVRKMPLPDNFVNQEIRAVHIMEHFCHPAFAGKAMQKKIGTTLEVLREMYRVLTPGARLVIVTPDFEKIAQTTIAKKIPLTWLQKWSVGGHLNEYDVHHWLWTKSDAERWFAEVGFTKIEDWNPIKERHVIRSLDWRPPELAPNPDWYKTEWFHWLFMEGTKPTY